MDKLIIEDEDGDFYHMSFAMRCLECGRTWQSKPEYIIRTCPNCKGKKTRMA